MSDDFCTIDFPSPFLGDAEPDAVQRRVESSVYREACEVYEKMTGRKAPKGYTPANYRLVYYGIEDFILAPASEAAKQGAK
jgi:hypothetical protein